MRKLAIGVLLLLGAGLLFAAGGLLWAHLAIRGERAPLPSPEAIVESAPGSDRPVRLAWINTASQAMPRSAVLDPARDKRTTDPYVMSHPSFVLEWSDGRMLLVDVGMSREHAISFGGPIALMTGGEAIQPLTAVAERLGEARARVRGALFTHLHTDHTGAIADVCAGPGHRLSVFMTDAQAERTNYTSRPGLALLRDAPCVQMERLTGGPLFAPAGFPGVFVIAAGGHTPDSQIIIAHVRGSLELRTYAFVGDIVNNIDGVNDDVPKPWAYRTLFVPEDGTRQAELRGFLKELRDRRDVTLLVSHDQRQLEASGIPAW